MFDGLLEEDTQATTVDALLKLIDHDKIDRITDLEMAQIKVQTIGYWFYVLKIYPDKSAIECQQMTIDKYNELKASYKRKGREEIVKGISEMREAFMSQGLIQDKVK